MTLSWWLRQPVAVASVLLVQSALLRGMRIDGVRPDLLLGLALVAGLIGGPERGAVTGFAAGLVADLFASTPYGLAALVWCLAGFAVGALQDRLLRPGRLFLPMVTVIASAIATSAFVLLATVLGQTGLVNDRLGPIIGIVAGLNGVAAIPLARLLNWTFARPRQLASR